VPGEQHRNQPVAAGEIEDEYNWSRPPAAGAEASADRDLAVSRPAIGAQRVVADADVASGAPPRYNRTTAG